MSNPYADGRTTGILDGKPNVPLWYTTPFEQKDWRSGYEAGREAAKRFGVTAEAEKMVAAVRAAWAAANNDSDPYTEREWAVACQRWLDLVVDELIENSTDCMFGNGIRVLRSVQPQHLCECCTLDAEPGDIFCKKHRRAEGAQGLEITE